MKLSTSQLGSVETTPEMPPTDALVQNAGRLNRLTEEETDFLEQQIPDMAIAAAKSAYVEALAAGLSVLYSEDNKMWELFPDGSRRFVKNLDARVHLPVGTRVEIS